MVARSYWISMLHLACRELIANCCMHILSQSSQIAQRFRGCRRPCLAVFPFAFTRLDRLGYLFGVFATRTVPSLSTSSALISAWLHSVRRPSTAFGTGPYELMGLADHLQSSSLATPISSRRSKRSWLLEIAVSKCPRRPSTAGPPPSALG